MAVLNYCRTKKCKSYKVERKIKSYQKLTEATARPQRFAKTLTFYSVIFYCCSIFAIVTGLCIISVRAKPFIRFVSSQESNNPESSQNNAGVSLM